MSPMPSMPKPTAEGKAAFLKLVPQDPAVTTRPMFGNLSAFVNGNMFTGLFGEDLFVRLPDAEREKIKKVGGKDFEPMPGRAMTGYVCLASTWRTKPEAARASIAASLDFTRRLPAKPAAARKAGSKKATPAKPGAARR